MNLLAFDTATEHMSVALQVGADVFSTDAPGGAKASAGLLPAVFALLAQAGVGLSALDAIAFGRGPGAFTGLRTACAVAQGLAYGANKPVLPIDTLLAIAESSRGEATGCRIWALLDARMGEVYAAQYRHVATGWEVLDAPRLASPASLDERWRHDAPESVAGNALGAFAGVLHFGDAVLHPHASPTARALLRLAAPLFSQGRAVDAALALPLYLRDKVAQTTAERGSARATKARASLAVSASADSPR